MSRKDESSAKPEDWIRVQPIIHQLYVVEQRPLHQVQKVLEEQHNFRATQRMYKSRIQTWRYDKKFKEAEWRQIISLWKKRRDEQGKDTIFKVRGRTINSAKIRKFLKRKKLDEATFLNQRSDEENPLSNIVCTTPPGSPGAFMHDSGSDASDGDEEMGSVPEVSRHNSVSWASAVDVDTRHAPSNFSSGIYRTNSVPSLSSSHMPTTPNYDSPGLVPAFTGQEIPSGFAGPPSESSGSSKQLVYGVDGMAMRSLSPDSVKLEPHDETVLSALLHNAHPPLLETQPSQLNLTAPSGPPSPTRSLSVKLDDADIIFIRPDSRPSACQNIFLDNESRQASMWLAHLFRAVIFKKQNRQDLVARCETDAAKIFTYMVDMHNRFLLPGLGVLSGILTAQNQWLMVAHFLVKCCEITEARRGAEDPFTIAFEHMYGHCARGLELPQKHVSQERLRNALRSFQLAWGKDHPNTIVLRYHLAWDTVNSGNPAQAEKDLRELLPLARQVMGPENYVTTGIMRSISRACRDQGKLEDAISFMSDALERQKAPLGIDHPERMEGFRRLGTYYREIGDLEKAEECFNTALVGQVKLLGANNSLTIGTLNLLEVVLKERGLHQKNDKLQDWIDDRLRHEQGIKRVPTFDEMSQTF